MRPIPKLLAALLSTAVLAGCGAPGAPLPPSLELPKPVADLRAVRKGDKVHLSWMVPTETTDGQSVRHWGPTQICRSLALMSECGVAVGETPPPSTTDQPKPVSPPAKMRASYTDTLSRDLQQKDPTGMVTYGVSVLNESGRSAGLSNQVRISAAPTLPPPSDFRAEVTADGVVVIWTAIAPPPELPQLRHTYRVYRRQEGSTSDTAIGEVQLPAAPTAQFVDQNFEWGKTYYYHATVVTFVSQEGKAELEVEGDDTPTVKVFADDIFPPAVPTGLQAVFSGEGQQPFIDLIWAPGLEADLAGYNIYRREENGQAVKLNTELVKMPAYRDTAVQSGKTYIYSVSAVDVRNNESARSEEASERVP
jgi:hypothetical protein